jgi:iron-sulfur cluster repair protein YtfE (RIC family)
MIDKNISIEDLVDTVPGSVRYMMDQGIKCIACGEPIWGTLEEAAKEKGFDDAAIGKFLEDLNDLQQNPPEDPAKGKRIDTKNMND